VGNIENEEWKQNFENLKFLIFDEADKLTETGHFRELKKITEFIYNKIETKIEQKGNSKEKIEKMLKNKNNSKTNNINERENQLIVHKLKEKGINLEMDDIETSDPLEMLDEQDEIMCDGEGSGDEKEEMEDFSAMKSKEIKQEKEKLKSSVKRRNVDLRTILCSATIEKIKKEKNQNRSKSNDQKGLDGLVKTFKIV